MDNDVILEMKNIDMRFQGVHALDDVSLTLRRGEVHALVGENGAGKSTLMKILIGLYTPVRGEILFHGQPVRFKSVMDTRKAGISMIFQEFNQVKHMTVMENIFLGREPKNRIGAIDFQKMERDSAALLKRLGIDLNPKTMMRDLTVAKFQLVEIVKAISYDAQIIIMDEPTSALSRAEIQYLMETVEMLRKEGKAIVYISHKMEEIYSLCQAVTVLRDGKFIHTGMVADVSQRDLIRMMVDRNIDQLYPKTPSEIGETVLEVKNLSSPGAFQNVSFSLRKGEILGFAGLMGAGRTEVMEAIMGMRPISAGEICLHGARIVNKIPTDAIKRGIVMVTEDRKRSGVILKLSVRDNILLSSLRKCVKGGFLRKALEDKCVEEYAGKLEIKMQGSGMLCANLSGGNQQKVAIAKALNADPQIIILDEPTRGIDVKTKSDIHALMSQLACKGISILMVSSELPEVLGMADRVVILHEGVCTGVLDRSEATPDTIMALAVGSTMEG